MDRRAKGTKNKNKGTSTYYECSQYNQQQNRVTKTSWTVLCT